jgi:ribonuclease BN (tRNA processing enzyme)
MGRRLIFVVSITLVACATPRAERTGAEAAVREPLSCSARGAVVQVLGSGGPIADDDRASAGYVVWVDGRAKLIVDVGGGTFQRLGAVRVDPRDPIAVLLTHLHVDHTADLPALLKSASFSERSARLLVVGPSGNERFPRLTTFVRALVGDQGAWPYLAGYLERDEPFALALREVDVESAEPAEPIDEDGLTVRAIGVRHGPVPALGYLVEAAGRRIGFTGDQRMDEDRFAELIRGVDLLIAHHAIPEDATDAMAKLHARPSQIGALAARAEVGALVLSHHMRRSLDAEDESLRQIRARYSGPVRMANDLDCF